MAGHIGVRTATPADAPAIRLVIERAIRQSAVELYSHAHIEAWASGGSIDGVRHMVEHSVACVAEMDGQVIGFANLVDSEVDHLYVDPDYGARGVARLLYEAIEVAARQEGLLSVTTVASLRAQPAFEAFGFHLIDHTERQFNGESFPVVKMRKEGLSPL